MSASWRLLLDQTVASPPLASRSGPREDNAWSQYQAIAELTTIVSRVHQTLSRSETTSGNGSMTGSKFEIVLAFTRDDILAWRTKHAKLLGKTLSGVLRHSD